MYRRISCCCKSKIYFLLEKPKKEKQAAPFSGVNEFKNIYKILRRFLLKTAQDVYDNWKYQEFTKDQVQGKT